MNDQVIERFMVSLGLKADTVALNDTIEKLRVLNALADSLERLKVFGIHVQGNMDAQPERIGFVAN